MWRMPDTKIVKTVFSRNSPDLDGLIISPMTWNVLECETGIILHRIDKFGRELLKLKRRKNKLTSSWIFSWLDEQIATLEYLWQFDSPQMVFHSIIDCSSINKICEFSTSNLFLPFCNFFGNIIVVLQIQLRIACEKCILKQEIIMSWE